MDTNQHPHASSVRSVAALAGLLAVAVYVVGVVVGGLVTPGYNHIVNAISELMLAGAPHRLGISVLFACYNIAMAAFALALPAATMGSGRAVRVGSWLLLAISVAGLGMILFPTDRPTDLFTATGWIHIGFASVASLGSMAAILSVGLGLRDRPEWRGFSAFSFVALAAIFVSGLAAARGAAVMSPTMGLAERVTIGVYFAWILVLAGWLASRPGRVKPVA